MLSFEEGQDCKQPVRVWGRERTRPCGGVSLIEWAHFIFTNSHKGIFLS